MIARAGASAASRYGAATATASASRSRPEVSGHLTRMAATIAARAKRELQSDVNMRSTSIGQHAERSAAGRVKISSTSHSDIKVRGRRPSKVGSESGRQLHTPSVPADPSLHDLKGFVSKSAGQTSSEDVNTDNSLPSSSSASTSTLSSDAIGSSYTSTSRSFTGKRPYSAVAAPSNAQTDHQREQIRAARRARRKERKKATGTVIPGPAQKHGKASKKVSAFPNTNGKKGASIDAHGVLEAEQDILRAKAEAKTLAKVKAASKAQGKDLEEELEVEGDFSRESPPHLGSGEKGEPKLPTLMVSKGTLSAADIDIHEVKPDREMTVNRLRTDLQKIPFNPGIHFIQDPRTGVWNFKPEQLYEIPTPEEFAFHRSPQYIPPGQDTELAQLAEEQGVRYTGSTSTLTKAMSQIYFALSGNRGVDLSYLSQAFSSERTDYTFGACLPACMVLGQSSNGTIYVDSDKSLDVENVLSHYGNILEKMLTTDADDFKRFLMSSPESAVPASERTEREAYSYQRANKILMRSQLDCYDPRLPGSGVFDIKTRACVPIRHDRANHVANAQYAIFNERGFASSFEREYYDLIRAAMLKYSFQARIGMMDGIFLAYHNTSQIFGFQYVPLAQIDEHLFGNTEMAEQAFRLTVALLEVLLDEITAAFPGEDINVTIKQLQPQSQRTVTAFVQPKNWDGSNGTRPTQAFALKIESFLGGEKVNGPVSIPSSDGTSKPGDKKDWTVKYELTRTAMDETTQQKTRDRLNTVLADIRNMMWIAVPEGKTIEEMDEARAKSAAYGDHDEDMSVTKWKYPDPRISEMRRTAKASAAAWEEKKKGWRTDQGEIYSWEPPKA